MQNYIYCRTTLEMAASSDSEDESFVELGRPLPFIEGEGKKKPITLQDASRSTQDSRGRPRFHGAFTGGFSAGYFNTVGTKEGWVPSTFTSSRQQKQSATEQRPEDFMDEDDLGEYGIAPRHFATSEAFSSEEQSRKRRAEAMLSTRDSILPASAALADLIVPERLPIGIKLLRKMGWKEGQGIGPRVKKKKKKENKVPGVKVYGCSLPAASDVESESDASDLDLENVTFAPKDVTPVNLTSKDNVHGLGYHGIDPRSALPGTHLNLFEAPAIKSSRTGKGIRGQAFGVGALEDEDEDVYTTDAMSNYDQTMELDDSEQFFGWTAPGSRKGKGKKDTAKVPVNYVGKLLEGFTLSAKPLPQKKMFPPPPLPKGFRPFHKFKKTAEQLAQEAVGEKPAATGQPPSRQKLNAVERGMMLDESPIATSVFDLIPKDDIRKLEAVKEAAKMAASRFHSAGTTSENSNCPTPTPKESSVTNQSSSRDDGRLGMLAQERTEEPSLFPSSFAMKPFQKDPAKQDRYDRYLALVKEGLKDPYEAVAGVQMTEWERQREREEFSKAAKIYRPLSSMMASRFTRGAFIDDPDQKSALVDTVREKSEAAKAAEMKMYGQLTREEFEWHPHNLICKRFNVPNPYSESDIVGVPGLKRDKFSVFTFLSVPTQDPHQQATSSTKATPQAKETTSSLTRELNVSKRMKGALSIFSVLEEDKDPPKALTALPHAAHSPKDPAGASNKMQEEEDKADEKTNKDKDGSDSDNEGHPLDLFRAIFKNSDSESSSSSDKSDDDKSDDDDEDNAEKPKMGDKDEDQSSPTVIMPPESQLSQEQEEPLPQQPAPPSQQAARDKTPPPPSSPPPPQPPQSTASAQSRPKKPSRWGVGSIFDVLDQSPPRPSSQSEQQEEKSAGEAEERLSGTAVRGEGDDAEVSGAMDDAYGPALPPPASMAPCAVTVADTYIDLTSSGHRKHKHKHREQARDSSKHRHKKDKKKKSKHKKEKKKKEKKKSKRSHGDRHRNHHSSGSEADSETDSDS